MAKKTTQTPADLLAAALVPHEDQPYAIPANWRWVRLGEVGEIVTGSTPSTKHEEYYGGAVPFVKPTDLEGGRCINTTTQTLTEAGEKISRPVRAGSTCVCCIGSIGKCGFLSQKSVTNQQINTISPYDFMNDLYVYYFCCGSQFQHSLILNSSSTTLAIINKGRMAKLPIPVAPLAEQARIAARIEELFAQIDEAEEKLRAAADTFAARRAALLRAAFTGRLTAAWRAAHGRSLDEWGEVHLRDICEVNPKKIDTKKLADDLEVSFLPMQSVSEISGEIVEPQTRLLKDVKKGYTNFSEGDVVFAKITPCMENGKSAIVGKLVNHIGYGTTEFYVLRCSENLYNRFLYHLVRSKHFRVEAKANMTGAVGQQRVPRSFMEEYVISLPPLDEQREIVRLLDDAFAEEERARQDLEAARAAIPALRRAILTRAFRGALGTGDPAEPPADLSAAR